MFRRGQGSQLKAMSGFKKTPGSALTSVHPETSQVAQAVADRATLFFAATIQFAQIIQDVQRGSGNRAQGTGIRGSGWRGEGG